MANLAKLSGGQGREERTVFFSVCLFAYLLVVYSGLGLVRVSHFCIWLLVCLFVV